MALRPANVLNFVTALIIYRICFDNVIHGLLPFKFRTPLATDSISRRSG